VPRGAIWQLHLVRRVRIRMRCKSGSMTNVGGTPARATRWWQRWPRPGESGLRASAVTIHNTIAPSLSGFSVVMNAERRGWLRGPPYNGDLRGLRPWSRPPAGPSGPTVGGRHRGGASSVAAGGSSRRRDPYRAERTSTTSQPAPPKPATNASHPYRALHPPSAGTAVGLQPRPRTVTWTSESMATT